MYCPLSCGKTKHLQNYAVDSFNYIFFKVNNTPEKPGGLFSTEVTPPAGVLEQPKEWHRIKKKSSYKQKSVKLSSLKE